MDVNGTRFHLLLGLADWGRCSDEAGDPLASQWAAGRATAAVYDTETDELTLRQEPFVFGAGVAGGAAGPGGAGGGRLLPAARRGAARDRYGNWYWVDPPTTGVLAYSSGSAATTRFWSSDLAAWPDGAAPTLVRTAPAGRFAPVSAAPVVPSRLAGVAVTDDHYLLVGVTEPSGLLVFDLQAGGSPDYLLWPADVPFTPFDLAARPGGGVFVLDRQQRRLWELDRSFRVVPRSPAPGPPPVARPRPFEPAAGEPPGAPVCLPGPPPALADGVALDAPGGDPVAVEAALDGTVLVLFGMAGAASAVRAYRDGIPAGPAVPLGGPGTGTDLPAVLAHDFALVPSSEPGPVGRVGRLFAVDDGGNQAFEFAAMSPRGGVLGLVPASRYYPMRLFGGKALVAAAGHVWYDLGERWLPLAEQPRRRFATEAVIWTDVLDGGEPGCVWHRLLLDACLPSETAVQVSSAAADTRAVLTEATPQWYREPPLYTRSDGSEQPYAQHGAYRTCELAFQQARGRYLRLALTLTGNGRAAPRIRALRAHYPRFSYLDHYLPAAYRADAPSASFLDRYLANLEGIATAIEDRIAGVQVLFDPRSAPAAALEWLAAWFELALDPAWDEARRRLLLAHAMDFFRWRGTVRGLQTVLALACEDRVDESVFSDVPSACARRTRIVERYQTKVTPGVALGDPSEAGGPAAAAGQRWRPGDGTFALHERYRAALRSAGIAAPDGTRFPLRPPGADQARLSSVWTGFARSVLGFVPAAEAGDLPAWRDFLARRYHRVAELNAAHQLSGAAAVAGFDEIRWPDTLPEADRFLLDWYQFQAVVRPSRQVAHRFRVLLPVSAHIRRGTDPKTIASRVALADLARRVVEVEKPAHTVFDVRFYWDAFRVGEARLGLDTLVDLGSRSPGLRTDAVLGRAHLGETVLASPSDRAGIVRRQPIIDRRCP